MELEVKALRVEKYARDTCEGHNCDFEYGRIIDDKHTLLTIDINTNKKYEIEFTYEEGECGSGWCTASWAYMKVKEVNNFRGYTHKPITKIYFNNFTGEEEEFDGELVSFSEDGGDAYYPHGYYEINMNLFKSNERYKNKRPVWIFKGKSTVGKSFIAGNLKDLNVYETDFMDHLPREIEEDIIVLGNKYSFSIEEIDSKILGEHELHIVDFK
ncbi:MAG: hypothetical protein RR942_01250 [Romboutsia sp.]